MQKPGPILEFSESSRKVDLIFLKTTALVKTMNIDIAALHESLYMIVSLLKKFLKIHLRAICQMSTAASNMTSHTLYQACYICIFRPHDGKNSINTLLS